MNPDIFLITGAIGAGMALAVVAYLLIDRAQRRAVARDPVDAFGPDWERGVNEALRKQCADILARPAYGTGDHTTTHHEGEL